MIFWLLLGLLCVFTVAVFAWPLLRNKGQTGLDDSQSQLAVIRDRQREVDREQAAGRLSAQEADDAREELVVQLAGDLPTTESSSAETMNPRRTITATALAVLVPILAFSIYQQFGQPQIGAYPELVSRDTPVTEAEIQRMLKQLIEHTEENPTDGQAWLTLAQAKRAMGEAAQSAEAFGRAASLLPPNARVLADQAEMTAVAQGRVFAGAPEQLLQSALRIDPTDLKANALISTALMQSGQHEKALPHLKIVQTSMEPDSEEGRQIANIVAGIEARGSRASTDESESNTPMVVGPTIQGRVELTGEIPPDATLFISARAPQGPRMPFAAVRIDNPSLPMRFELSDANAMTPERKLSDAEQVVVEARLSLSGNAIRQSGDRFGVSPTIATDSQEVVISIDQMVP